MASPGNRATQVLYNLAKLELQLKQAFASALKKECNRIMAISQQRVPVDTGALKASGYVTEPTQVAKELVVEIGYGHTGISRGYALFVHEIPSPAEGAPHPEQWTPGTRTARHKPPTTWKYLERPANSQIPLIIGNVTVAVKAEIGM